MCGVSLVSVLEVGNTAVAAETIDAALWHELNASGDCQITEKREYVFTDWDPSATSGLDALRSVFDTNGDGKLTAADSTFASFKVMVTKADGTTEAKTLAQLSITEIALRGDATRIELFAQRIIRNREETGRYSGP